MHHIGEHQLNTYMSLFKGRDDIYAKKWHKGGKTGYMPAYNLRWDQYRKHKAQGGTFEDFSPKTKLPLTREVIRRHVEGVHFIGLYPLLEDDTSWFLALDFDQKEWVGETKIFLAQCRKLGIAAYLEKSFSGRGAHIWIFFQQPYPAEKSRKIFSTVAKLALGSLALDREGSFDRMFPNQDRHTGKGFGNLIALPLNRRCLEQGRTVFLNPQSFAPFPDQWQALKAFKKMSAASLDALYAKLGKNPRVRERKTPNSALEIVLTNHIVLHNQQISTKLADFLKKSLIFINSEYIVKQKIGRSVYSTPKYFNLIKKSKHTVKLPRGFLGRLQSFCRKADIDFRIIDQRPKMEDIDIQSKIQLNKAQEKVMACCGQASMGVIVAPPGFGKTVLGIALIARKAKPALIMVHRRQIYAQWVERLQDFLGLAKKDLGQICSHKKKVCGPVTVAMIQSLVKFGDLTKIRESFGTIIIDECHHIPAKSFRKAITNFNPCYMFGLTATPKRKYNDEKMIYFYIGDILCNAQALTDESPGLGAQNVQLRIRDTSLAMPFVPKTDDFQILSKILIFDTARNRLIVEDIRTVLKSRVRILVLTERKDHVEVLGMYVKRMCETITLTGADSKSARAAKMKQIQEGQFQVLLATGQLLGEGLDIGHLRCLFLVFPFSFEGKLVQYVGRILRAKGPKQIYDYRDRNVDFLMKLYRKRERYYKKVNLLD